MTLGVGSKNESLIGQFKHRSLSHTFSVNLVVDQVGIFEAWVLELAKVPFLAGVVVVAVVHVGHVDAAGLAEREALAQLVVLEPALLAVVLPLTDLLTVHDRDGDAIGEDTWKEKGGSCIQDQ